MDVAHLTQLLAGILALRATVRLDPPPRNPQARPFQTAGKLGDPYYPSLGGVK